MSEEPAETDLATAVDALLDDADAVYREYDQGYIDADAALRRLRTSLDDLETAAEEA